LGQHGQPGHGRIWNEQLRVPMMLMAPDLKPGRHAGTVGVVDAIPTLLGKLSVSGREGFMAQASGVDVLGPDGGSQAVYSMQSMRLVRLFGEAPTHSLTTSDAKWVWSEGRAAVRYDRQADPYELLPIKDASAETRLRASREAQLRRAAALGAPEEQRISDETQQALEALGYME
jgi:arylsulfatase A-like enzyme